MPPVKEAKSFPVKLLDHNRLNGAFVCCLLHRIFVLCRNILGFYLGNISAGPISKTSGHVSQHNPHAVQVSSTLTFIHVSHIRFYQLSS